MTEKPFRAYLGADPFAFVSYAHDDAAGVYPELKWLNEQGLNIWYDEGISPGSRWSDAIAERIAACGHVVFFVSPRSVASQNCLDEVSYALGHQKPLLAIHLDETQLPPGLSMRLGSRQAILKYELSNVIYREKLRESLHALIDGAGSASAEASAAPQTHAPRHEPPSMAVVPFASLSRDEDQAFWAEGVTEDLRAVLSQYYRDWKIVAARPAHVGMDIKQVGEELGVRYVLAGSLRKVGERIRLSVSLSETGEGRQVWAERFDRGVDEFFDVQDEVIGSIHRAAGFAALAAEDDRLKNLRPENLDSWALARRAISIQVTDRESRDEQLALVRRALELESDYAYAHAVLARILWTNVYTSFSRDPEADTPEAVAHAERAAALAPDNAEALGLCVSVHLSLGNAGLGLELAERAYRISPDDTVLFNALNHHGRSSEVIERANSMTTISTPLTHRYVYSACMIEGKHDLALEWAQKAVGAMPDNYMSWMELANVLAVVDRLEESRAAVERAKSIVPKLKFALYEKGLLISYRHKAELVEPQVAGLRKLGIE